MRQKFDLGACVAKGAGGAGGRCAWPGRAFEHMQAVSVRRSPYGPHLRMRQGTRHRAQGTEHARLGQRAHAPTWHLRVGPAQSLCSLRQGLTRGRTHMHIHACTRMHAFARDQHKQAGTAASARRGRTTEPSGAICMGPLQPKHTITSSNVRPASYAIAPSASTNCAHGAWARGGDGGARRARD